MKKNIRFTGGDTQTGTTMISLAAAEMLAKEGERVLLISGGLFAGTEFLPRDISSGTDEVLSALLAENLSAVQMQQKSVITVRVFLWKRLHPLPVKARVR